MNFIPATGTGVVNGVAEVTLTNAVAGRDSRAIAHEAVVALPPGLDYELVMVVEPTGAFWDNTLLGMAFTPGTMSWYNDRAVVSTSVR